jgi:hypothetical protein
VSRRVNLVLDDTAAAVLDRLCRERELTGTQLMRQALGVFQIVHEARRDGLYVGTTKTREDLDTCITVPW